MEALIDCWTGVIDNAELVPTAGIVSSQHGMMTFFLIDGNTSPACFGTRICLYSVLVSSTYEDLRARVGWRALASAVLRR